MARGADLDIVRVRWIKGHVNYRAAVGMDKVHAWFNHWADLAAKEALGGHFTPLFQHLVKDFRRKLVLAKDLFSFQAGVAICSLPTIGMPLLCANLLSLSLFALLG